MYRMKVALLAAAVAAPFACAQSEQNMTEAVSFLFPDFCCTVLSLSSLKSRLLFPGQESYNNRLETYFDIKQELITPNCIVQPQNAKEVAQAVKTLTTASVLKQCKFAIRSGGHTPYAGASNIEDGVTIDLKYISSVDYDAQNKVVNVGPAAQWNKVFTTLEPLGVMTPGGRAATVGVGGLVLGGGISYFSGEHGLVADNVLEFEVVLADGRIVTASKTKNPDLFTVLKGGNNNFGIVTNLKFRTFPYNGMWGGLAMYPQTEAGTQQQFKALVNFSNNIDKNPKASVIVMPVYMSATDANLILNSYENAEPVPRPAALKEFLAIPGNISDSTGLRDMSSLAQELAEASSPSRVYFGTLTFANDLRVMTKAHEIFQDVVANLKGRATGEWNIYTLYQPLPPAYYRESVSRGGNALGLERFNNQVLCLYQPFISWQGANQDALFQQAGADLVNRIRAYAESIGADNPYLYLDYADMTQDPLASYGPESVKKMKAAAKKYDPYGVFQKLVPGGFKISKVQ